MNSPLVLMGHGSRDPEGAREFFELAEAVRRALPGRRVEAGVLEFPTTEAPAIAEAFERCAAAGAATVRAVPVLLSLAGHAKQDMPHQVAEAQRRHPGMAIELCPALGIDPLLLEIVEERIAAVYAAVGDCRTEETAILLAARGTSDPEANADMFKVARLLWERNGFPWVEPCFVSLAHPFVPEGVQRCAALGARTVLVLPYFINTGKLVHRIGTHAEASGRELPEHRVVVGRHLGVHPNLVRLIIERATAGHSNGRSSTNGHSSKEDDAYLGRGDACVAPTSHPNPATMPTVVTSR
ncbi:MAG: sirohydrochlorin chelatase [Dehalococcoidia bacterium]|nr:sirohydrochlorin chelatase [Dehalococcoidia bacterium]